MIRKYRCRVSRPNAPQGRRHGRGPARANAAAAGHHGPSRRRTSGCAGAAEPRGYSQCLDPAREMPRTGK